MRLVPVGLLFILLFSLQAGHAAKPLPSGNAAQIFGFRDATSEFAAEAKFLAVPDPKLAEEHLQRLTAAPHVAGSPEDRATADYVAQKFRDAGLDTEIVEYKVWFNTPSEIQVDVTAPANVHMRGPSREHVEGDRFQDDPRIIQPYTAMSPSADIEADVVYANYGSPEDFQRLADLKVDVRGKIVIVRYGQNFRGVKVLLAQEHGAAGVILYSDPSDDGWRRGDKYPAGPWRPDTAVQRGSAGYMFEFAGDPTTPGFASLPNTPEDKRTSPEKSVQMPKIPVTPLSYADAAPILEHLAGPESPRDWQGALPFTYHLGPGPLKVHIKLKQDYAYRSIWDVVGRVPGSDLPDEWVVAGNHRDAWVYGAVDPCSGTAAMLETVHGIGELLKTGWKPKRTMIFASWDAEEEGLIGSTEWGEQHEPDLANSPAYFNMDVAVSGPNFNASAVPSLKQFVRDITKAVPSPRGGTVYLEWRKNNETAPAHGPQQEAAGNTLHPPAAHLEPDVAVGDLGSGSDFTVFLQHLGVPATDIGSSGSYGVYHSAFDDFQWFKKFGDPDFVYEQQMARIFGLEMLRMSSADVLPYDYEEYGKEIANYLDAASRKAAMEFGRASPDFAPAVEAAHRLQQAGAKMLSRQNNGSPDTERINRAVRQAERALLIPEGLPNRPWYRHSIYAPGVYTGYAAVVIPGINEAIDRKDAAVTREQIALVTEGAQRAARVLEKY